MRNVRLDNVGSEDRVWIRFDYGEGTTGLGEIMPRADAEPLLRTIQSAAAAAGSVAETAATAATAGPGREAPRPAPAAEVPKAPERPPPSLTSPSGLALIAANLLPLAGVLVFGWDLATVMVLFWAESAVIGFYTVLKIAIVGKFLAVFYALFFVGHFGGFMAGHFLFIYGLFVRGLDAAGPEPGVREARLGIFVPIWPSLAALFISHGISFVSNFLGRREYASATMKL